MTMTQRIQEAETHVFKTVFPHTTNHHDTLFGGTALQWMDEVAFITATRFSRKRMVTVSSDSINFTMPIPAGSLVELIGRVEQIGRTSLKIAVDIFVEEMYQAGRKRAIHGSFTFVAVNDSRRPTPV